MVIEGNDVHDNQGVEVAVLSVKGAVIEVDAVIENNTLGGSNGPPTVICENTSPRISKNIITNRGATGIMIIAAAPHIVGNNISTDGPAGIYIKSGSSPTVESNNILGGGRRGIVGDTSLSIIQNNNILDTSVTRPDTGAGAGTTSPEKEDSWF